jgi:glycerophosphoryl diester phosphodiesterase
MKAFLIDVFHHGKVKFKLVQFNFFTLLIFAALYTLVGTEIVYPGSYYLFTQTMNQLGFSIISDANILQVLTNPLCLLTILALILVLGFYGLFELTTLIVLFNESHFKRRVSLLPLCQKGFERALLIFKPRNFPLLIFVLFVIPFTEFSLASSFVAEVSIPEFLMSHILASPLLSIIYFTITLLLFCLVIFWVFSLHYFTLEDQSFIQAIKKSRRLIKGHFWHTTFWVAFWNAAILLILLILLALLELVSLFVLNLLIDHTLALSMFIGGFGFFVSVFFTTFQLIETSITFSLVSMFYYDYSQMAGIRVSDSAAVFGQNNTSGEVVVRKKMLVGVSVIAIFTIVLMNGYLIYTSFNDHFNSHFFEGPDITAQSNPMVSPSESTRSFLQRAIEEGADYAEIDVAQTRDGVVVVSQPTIAGTSSQSLNISETTADELKNSDVLPLADVLLFCKDKIKLSIQINSSADDTSLVPAIFAVIQQANARDGCILASSDELALNQAALIDPQIRRAYVTGVAIGDIQTIPVDALSIESTFITPNMVTAIHGEHKAVFAWTVNSEETMTEMIHLGVDNLITQDTLEAKEVIHHMTEPRELIESINDFLFKDIVI